VTKGVPPRTTLTFLCSWVVNQIACGQMTRVGSQRVQRRLRPKALGRITRYGSMFSDRGPIVGTRKLGIWTKNVSTLSEVTRRSHRGGSLCLIAASVSIEPFQGSRWRLRRTRQVWVLNGLLVLPYRIPARCIVPGWGRAKHGDDPTPDARCGARALPARGKPDPLRTRSVRRASGLLVCWACSIAWG